MININEIQRSIYALKATHQQHVAEMEQATEQGDTDAFEAAKTKAHDVAKQITQKEAVLEAYGRYDPQPMPPADPATEKQAKPTGASIMLKMMRGVALSEQERGVVGKALFYGDNAASGENYIVPTDVCTEIRELRKSYVSARELVNVIPVDTLFGSTVFESGSPSGLTAYDDGDTIATETNPTFVQKAWKIGWYGKIIPVSRVLAAAAAGLSAYLNRWFVRSSIVSENAKIFAALKAGYASGTPKAIAGWKALKKSITEDLDPSCLINGVIATNQSGFACLDAEEDADGRPILQCNPANPTEKLFQGLPIKVYPNSQLANIDATHFPLIFGDTQAGIDFMIYQDLLFETSEHYLFGKNQNALRMQEGFVVVNADTGAYIYSSFSATPAATTTDKSGT